MRKGNECMNKKKMDNVKAKGEKYDQNVTEDVWKVEESGSEGDQERMQDAEQNEQVLNVS